MVSLICDLVHREALVLWQPYSRSVSVLWWGTLEHVLKKISLGTPLQSWQVLHYVSCITCLGQTGQKAAALGRGFLWFLCKLFSGTRHWPHRGCLLPRMWRWHTFGLVPAAAGLPGPWGIQSIAAVTDPSVSSGVVCDCSMWQCKWQRQGSGLEAAGIKHPCCSLCQHQNKSKKGRGRGRKKNSEKRKLGSR